MRCAVRQKRVCERVRMPRLRDKGSENSLNPLIHAAQLTEGGEKVESASGMRPPMLLWTVSSWKVSGMQTSSAPRAKRRIFGRQSPIRTVPPSAVRRTCRVIAIVSG